MKILIAEDDFASRLLLAELLKPYGGIDVTVNGREAVTAFQLALESGEPYGLVCLDIMMPEKDGHEALNEIRAMESGKGLGIGEGARVLMVTALDDLKNVSTAFYGLCDGYLPKPVQKTRLLKELRDFGLIPPGS